MRRYVLLWRKLSGVGEWCDNVFLISNGVQSIMKRRLDEVWSG